MIYALAAKISVSENCMLREHQSLYADILLIDYCDHRKLEIVFAGAHRQLLLCTSHPIKCSKSNSRL